MKPSIVRHPILLLTLVIAVCIAGASAASAEELPKPAEPAARAHLDAGNKAFDEAKAASDASTKTEKFRVAIREYMAGLAAETKFHYTFYWNLGHAHRQLGEYTRAEFFYRKFLEYAPERLTNYRSSAEDFRRMMQADIDKAAAAEQAAALSAAGASSGKSAPDPQGPALTVLPSPARDAPPETPSWYSDRPAWGLVGVGLAGTVIGGGFLLNSSSLFDQASDEDRQSVKADLENDARSRRTIGFISGGIGVAFLAAGVIKLSITPSPSKPASVHVTVGPSSFSFQGSF